jgi:hypothetical protein
MADRDDGWLPAGEKLTPERAVRLLRAKGAEMESWVLHNAQPGDAQVWQITANNTAHVWQLTADIALIAQLVADHIEAGIPTFSPNLTPEMLASHRPYVTKSGRVLSDADIEALADEAERGYDVSELKERTCLATRWNGHPVYEGEHEHHFFDYGPNDMYTGHCAGWPKAADIDEGKPRITFENQAAQTSEVPGSFPVGTTVEWTESHPPFESEP